MIVIMIVISIVTMVIAAVIVVIIVHILTITAIKTLASVCEHFWVRTTVISNER